MHLLHVLPPFIATFVPFVRACEPVCPVCKTNVPTLATVFPSEVSVLWDHATFIYQLEGVFFMRFLFVCVFVTCAFSAVLQMRNSRPLGSHVGVAGRHLIAKGQRRHGEHLRP